jgi:hypothetical protein
MLFNLKLIFMKKPKKYCKNPDCEDEIVDYKSSKREYCSDYCRNHHGHKRRSEENLEITIQNKCLSKNYKVLKLYKEAGILNETLDKYEKFGFNPFYLPAKKLYEHEGKKYEYYVIKDITFRFNLKENTIIIINQHFKK